MSWSFPDIKNLLKSHVDSLEYFLESIHQYRGQQEGKRAGGREASKRPLLSIRSKAWGSEGDPRRTRRNRLVPVCGPFAEGSLCCQAGRFEVSECDVHTAVYKKFLQILCFFWPETPTEIFYSSSLLKCPCYLCHTNTALLEYFIIKFIW